MSNRLLLIIIGLLVANLVVGIVKSPTDTTSVADDGSVGLERPWFIDEALASDDRSARAVANIADEAGISAYVKTPTAINLTLARTALTSIIESNANYVLGTITPTGYTGDFGAQVMIHKTGWIMAWYPKDQVASMIVHTRDSTFANKTKLSLIIDAVTTKLRIRTITPNYYHFKYPTANRMVIASKSSKSGREIKISMPISVIAFESSANKLSNTGTSGFNAGFNGYLYINDIMRDCSNEICDITMYLDNNVNILHFGSSGLAVVIIYQV